jgi:hypothetical protein
MTLKKKTFLWLLIPAVLIVLILGADYTVKRERSMHLFAYTSQKTLDNGNPVSLLDAPVTDDSGKLKLYDIVYDAGESALTLHFDYFRAPDTAYAEVRIADGTVFRGYAQPGSFYYGIRSAYVLVSDALPEAAITAVTIGNRRAEIIDTEHLNVEETVLYQFTFTN